MQGSFADKMDIDVFIFNTRGHSQSVLLGFASFACKNSDDIIVDVHSLTNDIEKNMEIYVSFPCHLVYTSIELKQRIEYYFKSYKVPVSMIYKMYRIVDQHFINREYI